MNKDLEYYMNLPYQEVIKSSADGGYVGYFPELPGCITQGETIEEIKEMMQDAKLCWILGTLEDGYPVPEPESNENYSGKFNLRVSKSLHRQLAMQAKVENVSLNTLATTFIAQGLGSKRA